MENDLIQNHPKLIKIFEVMVYVKNQTVFERL